MNEELTIPCIKVNQWMESWDKVIFDRNNNTEFRNKPDPYFYIFKIKASLLRKLSNVYRRKADADRTLDNGIQRMHDQARSTEINRFIEVGFPLSEISKGKQIDKDQDDLRMPGWLPTAIIANILSPETKREGRTINNQDIIKVLDDQLELPLGINDDGWNPEVAPIEIIDGQHRLWAFDFDDDKIKDYELPVVAFFDLDLTWQAYLFYTINIKPKKINRSLAYDLYPLLRVQEWLEKSPDKAFVYKETRAQEIVEVLWSYPFSPWKNRINMLGDTNSKANISQAAFIRSMVSTFFKTSLTNNIGGLFGSKLNDKYNSPLIWDRAYQAAFTVFIWQKMYTELEGCKENWAINLIDFERNDNKNQKDKSLSDTEIIFTSKYNLLTTDQGVRGFLHIINDFIFFLSDSFNLRNIYLNSLNSSSNGIDENNINIEEIQKAIEIFIKSDLNMFLTNICLELTKFDWRTSSMPTLSREQSQKQMVFKGSSGYRELRKQLIELLINSEKEDIQLVSTKLGENLKLW